MSIAKIKELLSEINYLLDSDKQKTEECVAFSDPETPGSCVLEVATKKNNPFIFKVWGRKEVELTKVQAEELAQWILATNEKHIEK